MTAPVPNAIVATPTVQAGAHVHVKVAGGPLGGFEAIFASLFGQAAGLPTASGVAPVAGGKALDLFAPPDEGAETTADGEVDPNAETTVAVACPDPNLAGLALATTSAKIAEAAPDAATGETAATTAFGRDKAKGSPAAPALANANPHARLAEKAGLDTEDAAADATPSATAPQPQKQAKLDLPQAPAAQGRPADAATPEPKAATAPSDTPAADALPTAAVTDTEATATLPEATAPAAALAAKPGAPAPARGPQAPKSERGRDAIDGPGASRPTGAARKAAEAAPDAPVADAPPVDREAGDASARTRLEEDAPDSTTSHADTPLQTTGPAPTHAAHTPVRGAPETVANLAAQIIKKLENRSTRFDLELNPAGLGKVDVRLEIGAAGQVSAALTFDNPQAAADLKSRANDLQRALEQAGFNLSGGLSFDVAGDRGQAQQGWREAHDQSGQGHRGRAFQDALATADNAVDQAVSGALRLRRGLMSALDLRI